MNLKPWQCRNNHTLGMIFSDGNGVPLLMLYREAVDLQADDPEQVKVMGPLWGSMPVTCSECGDVVPWEISMETLARMLYNLSQSQVNLLERHYARLKRRDQGSGLYRPE